MDSNPHIFGFLPKVDWWAVALMHDSVDVFVDQRPPHRTDVRGFSCGRFQHVRRVVSFMRTVDRRVVGLTTR